MTVVKSIREENQNNMVATKFNTVDAVESDAKAFRGFYTMVHRGERWHGRTLNSTVIHQWAHSNGFDFIRVFPANPSIPTYTVKVARLSTDI